MENNIDSSDNLGFSLDSVKHTLQPFTCEMWSFLLVNALRSLKEEQRAGLCFDLYCRSDLREDIDKKISDLKLREKNINLEFMKKVAEEDEFEGKSPVYPFIGFRVLMEIIEK
jgi:hypothetical protein